MPRSFLYRWTGVALFALLLLTGCDESQQPTDAPEPVPSDSSFAPSTDPTFAALVDALGHDAITALLTSEDEAAAAAAFAPLGVRYVVVDVTADEAMMTEDAATTRLGTSITECPEYFDPSAQNTWFTLKGASGSASHYIGESGRPIAAYKRLPPDVAAPRSSSCQTSIGNWATPASSYDGGHLIGSQLGGWGRRANIVPQHFNFNRGNWKRVEDRLAQCDALPDASIQYYVIVDYPDGAAVTPDTFHSYVNGSLGGWVGAHFPNETGGGPNGRAESDRVIDHLIGLGC